MPCNFYQIHCENTSSAAKWREGPSISCQGIQGRVGWGTVFQGWRFSRAFFRGGALVMRALVKRWIWLPLWSTGWARAGIRAGISLKSCFWWWWWHRWHWSYPRLKVACTMWCVEPWPLEHLLMDGVVQLILFPRLWYLRKIVIFSSFATFIRQFISFLVYNV